MFQESTIRLIFTDGEMNSSQDRRISMSLLPLNDYEP